MRGRVVLRGAGGGVVKFGRDVRSHDGRGACVGGGNEG